MAIRLHPLAEITGNLSMESQIRDVLKQLYGKSHKGIQYFLDPLSTLPYPYPVRTKDENNTKSCKCVFIGYKDLQDNTLEKLYSGYILQLHMLQNRYLMCGTKVCIKTRLRQNLLCEHGGLSNSYVAYFIATYIVATMHNSRTIFHH